MALYRHVARWTYPTATGGSVALYSSGTASLAAAQSAWVTGLTDLTGALSSFYTTDVVIDAAATYELDESTGRQLSVAEDAVSLPGAATGSPLPAQVAVVVSLRTTSPTRAGRGRIYLWPFAASALDDGRIDATAVTAAATGVKDAISELQAIALDPVLYSRKSHIASLLVSLDVGDVWDTQRRRRDKMVETRTSQSL